MNKTLLIAALLAAPTLASADPVSDRVYLTPTYVPACGANAKGFTRVIQQPDGSSQPTPYSAEFVVPQGMYFEITSIDYRTPYWTMWAKDYPNYLDVTIRQRYGTMSTSVLSAVYMNQTFYGGDTSTPWTAIGEYASPGAQTHVVSYPVGPIMNTNGRLCAQADVTDFWNFSGNVTVRGRLIPTGSPVATTTTNAPLSP